MYLISPLLTARAKPKFDDFTTVSKKKKGKKEDQSAAAATESAKAPEPPKLTQEDLFASGNGKRVRGETLEGGGG